MIRRFVVIEFTLFRIHQLLPIRLSESWEEGFELSLKILFLDHSHEQVVGEDVFAPWLRIIGCL